MAEQNSLGVEYDELSPHYDERRFSSAYSKGVSHREIQFVLQSLRGSSSVLEVGPGTGRFGEQVVAVEGVTRYVAVDASAEMLRLAESRIRRNAEVARLTFLVGDIYDIENVVGFGGFDAIVCMRLLPHLDNLSGALDSLLPLLSPDGVLIIDNWNMVSFVGLGRRLLGKKTNIHIASRSLSDFTRVLTFHGLVVEDQIAWGFPRAGPVTTDRLLERIAAGLAYSVVVKVRRRGGSQ